MTNRERAIKFVELYLEYDGENVFKKDVNLVETMLDEAEERGRMSQKPDKCDIPKPDVTPSDLHPMDKLQHAVSCYQGAGNAYVYTAAKEACEWWESLNERVKK
jgi:hypothetical protein